MLSAEEVRRLNACVVDSRPGYSSLKTNGRYTALISMGCWLGPRWNEAIGVRVRDLNPMGSEISFGRVVTNQNGNERFEEHMTRRRSIARSRYRERSCRRSSITWPRTAQDNRERFLF